MKLSLLGMKDLLFRPSQHLIVEVLVGYERLNFKKIIQVVNFNALKTFDPDFIKYTPNCSIS